MPDPGRDALHATGTRSHDVVKTDGARADSVGMQSLAAPNGSPVTPAEAAGSPAHPAVRVLAAIDDDHFVAALRVALAARPAEIVAEPLPERALTRLRSERFDIIVGDLRPGRTAGLEMLITARRECPTAMRMVLAEADASRELLEAVAATGVYRLLHPSVAVAELRATFGEAIEQRATLARAATAPASPVVPSDRLTVNP